MIELNREKHVLMECEYKYQLQDREEGNFYRDMFTYSEPPKCTFNFRLTPANMPEDIWITDTTFRDGQQSRAPYEPGQIVELFKMLPYLVTIAVLILISTRKKRENQPPAHLGLSYFREER